MSGRSASLNHIPPTSGRPPVEGAVGRDRVERRETLALARREVVHAEGRRGVDDARAVLRRHVVGRDDAPGGAAPSRPRRRGRTSARSAAPTRSAPVISSHDLVVALEDARRLALGDDQELLLVVAIACVATAGLDVVDRLGRRRSRTLEGTVHGVVVHASSDRPRLLDEVRTDDDRRPGPPGSPARPRGWRARSRWPGCTTGSCGPSRAGPCRRSASSRFQTDSM